MLKSSQKEDANPCYVICPKCNNIMNLHQKNSNLQQGERDVIRCKKCWSWLTIISIGDALKVIES